MRDNGFGVTYMGDAPILDGRGYLLDVGWDDHGNVLVKTALTGKDLHGIRTDITDDQVDDLIDRLTEARSKAKEKK